MGDGGIPRNAVGWTVLKYRQGLPWSAGVPRYFFHFSDGKRQFSDGTGHELHGVGDARRHAVQQVRELKVAMCDPHIVDLSGWSMTVVDACGLTVFEIGFDLKPCAAEWPRAAGRTPQALDARDKSAPGGARRKNQKSPRK